MILRLILLLNLSDIDMMMILKLIVINEDVLSVVGVGSHFPMLGENDASW